MEVGRNSKGKGSLKMFAVDSKALRRAMYSRCLRISQTEADRTDPVDSIKVQIEDLKTLRGEAGA